MPSDKRAQAARRLRKRLEAQQANNDAAAKNIGKSLLWLVGAIVVISALVLVADIIAALWQWIAGAISGTPWWMAILVIMALAYSHRAKKAETLRRKIQKLREIEKEDIK